MVIERGRYVPKLRLAGGLSLALQISGLILSMGFLGCHENVDFALNLEGGVRVGVAGRWVVMCVMCVLQRQQKDSREAHAGEAGTCHLGMLTSTPAAAHAAMTLEPFVTCTGCPLTKHSIRSSARAAEAWKERLLVPAAYACDITLALLAALDACCASRWSAIFNIYFL